MSDHYITLIPDLPSYVPLPEAQARALALLREFLVDAQETRAEEFSTVQFIDCGTNFEKVSCPDCGTELDQEWFGEVMDEDYEDGFKLVPLSLPCCSAQRRLDELVFDWPQGFARFQLEAINPGRDELPKDVISQLERILGCKLRKILRHL